MTPTNVASCSALRLLATSSGASMGSSRVAVTAALPRLDREIRAQPDHSDNK
jgi:hypothetical protein